MIICIDTGTLSRYTVKPTLDQKWSLFRKNREKRGWKRLHNAPIWESPWDAAEELAHFRTRGRYRMWAVVKDADAPIYELYKDTPDLGDLLPEEAWRKSDD